MNNIPLTNMAVSLSGGGYRATTFHLGALCLLDAIELEAGNQLILDENRRKEGATLLENVRVISTISGGTLTGVMYALKLSQGEDFKDCFYKLYDLLDRDDLVKQALDKLASPWTWKNHFKNRNLINAFSEVYNEHFYDEATFGDLNKNPDVHLTDAIFGASEFTAGLQYRFQESGRADFGSGDLYLPKEVAEKIRLADAAASSSCFPGGFEPMTMPTDYSNGPESRVEEWWTNRKINFDREATIAKEKAAAAAKAAEQAAAAAPEVAATIVAALKKRSAASRQLETATEKSVKASMAAERAAKKLEAALAAEKPDLQEKAQKTTTKADKAKSDFEAATAAVSEAAEQYEEAAQSNPELATILAKAEEAENERIKAVALADEAISDAEKRLKKAERAAEKAAIEATTALKQAQQLKLEQEGAYGARTLQTAENAAVDAETATEEAKSTAVKASEAAADLALIKAERAVEYILEAERKADAALSSNGASGTLEEMLRAAKSAQLAAKESEESAEMARTFARRAEEQKENCYEAVSLAEDASAEVASYSLEKGEKVLAKKGGKGKSSKAYKAYKGDTVKVSYAANTRQTTTADPRVKEENLRKATAYSAASGVHLAAANVVAAAEQAVATAAGNSSQLQKAIQATSTAAKEAFKLAAQAEKASSNARRAEPYRPVTAIMDGGILDNQGIRGVVMTEKRYSKDGKLPPFIGTYIISDVSGKTMAPYAVPTFTHSSVKDFFSLQKVNWIAAAVFLGLVALLFFADLPKWGVILSSVFATILLLWFVIFYKVRSLFRAKVTETFAGEDLPEIMKDMRVLVKTPFYIVTHLMAFRATSSLKMITDVFLRRIRRLQLHGLYKSPNWNYRIVSNNIYELKDAQKLTPKLKEVIDAANNMPTTLWFTQQEKNDEALDDLIACGQLTLCSNLANYLRSLKKGRNKELVWDNISDYHDEIDAVLEVVEHFWHRFRVDPKWLIRQYLEERPAG